MGEVWILLGFFIFILEIRTVCTFNHVAERSGAFCPWDTRIRSELGVKDLAGGLEEVVLYSM